MVDSGSKFSLISSLIRRPKLFTCSVFVVFFTFAVLNPSIALGAPSASRRRGLTESSADESVTSLPIIEGRAGPTVKLAQGTLVGKVITDRGPKHLDSFFGVRYAEAPVGDRRFGRTKLVGPSDETFQATTWGARWLSTSHYPS